MKNNQTIFISLLLVLFTGAAAFAQDGGRDRSTKKAEAAAQQSSNAARVFNEIMGTREKSIPGDLLDKAEAVAVFPGVLKGGFIVGGRGGSGVISRRVPGGWSAPAFSTSAAAALVCKSASLRQITFCSS